LTGQRRAHGAARSTLAVAEFDAARGMPKFNPLAHWPDEAVWHYIEQHQVPVNPLHARGYPSIGCEPCTRAIRPGEDPRAGRWWWEHQTSKECGLHVARPGTTIQVTTLARELAGQRGAV
jgi:phosphoadenosine phosphosulfate reductase